MRRRRSCAPTPPHGEGRKKLTEEKRPDDTATAARAQPYVVVCRRFDGRERIWSRYADREDCERVAAHLTSIGCPSRCVGDQELPLEGAP